MILKGENQEIELVVEGYEFSDPVLKNNFWDWNWLMLYCKKTIEGKTVKGRFACFVTTELKCLQDLLEQFLNGEIECVEWNGTEPNFQITLHKNRLLEIYFYSEGSSETFDGVKIFRKLADLEDIKNLIKFCEDSLSKYPIRRVEEHEGI